MAVLEDARDLSANDLEYAGAASFSYDIVPLEEAVDEARRMVCALQGEERRRSEGELPKWLRAEPVMPRTISAGL